MATDYRQRKDKKIHYYKIFAKTLYIIVFLRAYGNARRNERKKNLKKINKKAVYGGLGLGAVNGLFGGGGGMIAVPILADVLGYPR